MKQLNQVCHLRLLGSMYGTNTKIATDCSNINVAHFCFSYAVTIIHAMFFNSTALQICQINGFCFKWEVIQRS